MRMRVIGLLVGLVALAGPGAIRAQEVIPRPFVGPLSHPRYEDDGIYTALEFLFCEEIPMSRRDQCEAKDGPAGVARADKRHRRNGEVRFIRRFAIRRMPRDFSGDRMVQPGPVVTRHHRIPQRLPLGDALDDVEQVASVQAEDGPRSGEEVGDHVGKGGHQRL